MHPNSEPRLRILHLNTNGITSKNNYIEWESLLDMLDEYQTDIYCLNEINVDTQQSKVQYDLRERAKRQDKHTHLSMNSSKQLPATINSIFKSEGTMMGTRGNWSGRVINIQNDPAKDKLGRWTATHIRGVKDTILTIISVYQVCSGGGTGDNTAYLQQQTYLYKERGRHLDPRNAICKDLRKVLQHLNECKHKIIICADINDDVGHEFQNQWNSVMEEAGMQHIIQTMHDHRALPRTYDRGKRCLDTIMISDNIENDSLLRSGILPFYSVTVSDHRAMYLDIDTTKTAAGISRRCILFKVLY